MTQKSNAAETADATAGQTAAANPDEEVVTLDYPIRRGSQEVSEITVRKPKSGALRGVSLTDVLQMDVTALTRVLPRITEPALTEAELRDVDPADLVQLGTAVTGFLLPRRLRDTSG